MDVLTPEEDESCSRKYWLEFRTFDHRVDGQDPKESTDALARFHQFIKLPAELRLKIWLCSVEPRIIVVCCLERDGPLLPQHQAQLQQHSKATGKDAPAILHVNREARDVGLKHYELTFSWRIPKLLSDQQISSPARIWFNYELDTLYMIGDLEIFESGGFNTPVAYFLRREDANRVRNIACPFRELGYPELESDQIFGRLWHVADRFRAATRVLMTLNEEDEKRYEGERGCNIMTLDNVVQKIWDAWMASVKLTGGDGARLADKWMLLVQERSLAPIVAGRQQIL